LSIIIILNYLSGGFYIKNVQNIIFSDTTIAAADASQGMGVCNRLIVIVFLTY